MALNKFILLFVLLIVFTGNSFAQEKFLGICQQPQLQEDSVQTDVRWLKYFFKTEDCSEIAAKLSSLKSFNEFMVGHYKLQHVNLYSWMDDMPYLNGLSKSMKLLELPLKKLGINYTTSNIFRRLDIYSEFKNLKIIDMGYYNYSSMDVCTLKDVLPQIEIVLVNYESYERFGKCQKNKIPWLILTGDYVGSHLEKNRDKVIGIDSYLGRLDSLHSYKNLRYLGINGSPNDEGISALALNVNLTHLSLNTHYAIENISELRELQNLRYLALSCVTNTLEFLLYKERPKACDKPLLDDLNFLMEFQWLQSLTLTYNKVQDVSFLKGMKRLKYLDLSNNDIKTMPDLSHMTELKFLNLKNNPVDKK